jgi:hypothetical protein
MPVLAWPRRKSPVFQHLSNEQEGKLRLQDRIVIGSGGLRHWYYYKNRSACVAAYLAWPGRGEA